MRSQNLLICDRDLETVGALFVRIQHDLAEFGFVAFLDEERIMNGEARGALVGEVADDAQSNLRPQVH